MLRIIAGEFKGRSLKTPKVKSTRPTQSMLRGAVFNICQQEIEGARFLDLFAGSGAMAFEAVSRGASQAVLVEENRAAVQCIRDNIKTLDVEARCELFPVKAERALELFVRRGLVFDLIYIDPPYAMGFDLDQLIPVLAPGGRIFLEERKGRKTYNFTQFTLVNTRVFGDATLALFKQVNG